MEKVQRRDSCLKCRKQRWGQEGYSSLGNRRTFRKFSPRKKAYKNKRQDRSDSYQIPLNVYQCVRCWPISSKIKAKTFNLLNVRAVDCDFYTLLHFLCYLLLIILNWGHVGMGRNVLGNLALYNQSSIVLTTVLLTSKYAVF